MANAPRDPMTSPQLPTATPDRPTPSARPIARALLLGCLLLWLLGACWTDETVLSSGTPPTGTATRQAAIASTNEVPLSQRAAPMVSLWRKVAEAHRRGDGDAARRWQRLVAPLSFTQRSGDDLRLQILFAYTGPKAALQRLGIMSERHQANIHTGWLPLHRLEAFLALPGLQRVALSRRLRPHLNVSAPLVFAPQARFRHGVDGRGVIVGIVDTGVDHTHPAFRREDGTTRILAILDFSQEGESPQKPLVITAKEINEALRGERSLSYKDESGHGTHVAGIAVGNGRSDNPKEPTRYMGMAPRADLIVVKGLRRGQNDFSSADVVTGLQFIHQTATFLGKPYVVNLSLGGHQGGHDGGSLLELALAPYTGSDRPGQLIVASAGNEGNEPIHASGWLQRGHSLALPLEVPPSKPAPTDNNGRIALELWYPMEGRMTLQIRSPRGHLTAVVAPSDDTPGPQKWEWDDGVVSIQARTKTRKPSGRSYAVFLAAPQDGTLGEGKWELIIGGETPRFDAWIAETSRDTFDGRAFFRRFVTQEVLIGLPASSPAVLTVGSYNSRSGWSNAAGEIVANSPFLGVLSAFSSMGPTRDGRTKPDITAPGLYIAAPTPLSLPIQARGKLSDGPYRISQGTSQAAPHLTGCIALMLQLHPTLTLDDIKTLLHRTGHTDAYTRQAAVYQSSWGFGKLDVLTAINTLEQGASTRPIDPRRSTLGVLFERLPADGRSSTRLVVIPKDSQGHPIEIDGQSPDRKPLKIELTTDLGTIIKEEDTPPKGVYWARLQAAQEPGVATVTATIDGTALHSTRTIRFTAATNATGCGCQIQTRPPPSLWNLLWLALLAWLLTRRARHPSPARGAPTPCT